MDKRIKTARSAGAVGRNAKVPRVARTFLAKGNRVLDFGCGPQGVHVQQLVSEGYVADGYDLAFLGEVPPKWALWEADLGKIDYHLVYASNVINVQATEEELFATCQRLRRAAGWENEERVPCPILLNYPGDPRKLGWAMKRMKQWLRDVAFGVKPIAIEPGVMLFPVPDRIYR